MFGIGTSELVVIIVFAIIFVGPKKIPELAKGIGKGIRDFQRAKNGLISSIEDEDDVKDKVSVSDLNSEN